MYDSGMGEKKFSIYLLGIFLCTILTIIPYLTVKYAGYSYIKTVSHIYITAIAQFFVQLICFIRLNYNTEQAKINVMSFVFSMVVTVVVIAGSLWIMWNLNYNMEH